MTITMVKKQELDLFQLDEDNDLETMDHMKKRHRRHTIARPISALALLSDSSVSDSEEDYQFDRISDILSNLIQEANEAVSYDNKKVVQQHSIPMVRKLSTGSSEMVKSKKMHRTISPRPVSSSSSSLLNTRRRSTTPVNTIITTTTKRSHSSHQLLESFKRLDSSMAVIDSLSRDLVPQQQQRHITLDHKPMVSSHKAKPKNGLESLTSKLPFDSRLSALLLIPLLHVPHVLISMVFDNVTFANYPHSSHSQTSSFSGMLVWAVIFAVASLVMDNPVVIPSVLLEDKKSLPGTFDRQNQSRHSSSGRKRLHNNNNTKKAVLTKRRGSRQTFIPQPSQSKFVLLERKGILSRRNSL